MKKLSLARILSKLCWSAEGNGEIVGVLVAVALAVGACVLAMKTLGTGTKAGAGQLGGQVSGLSVQ